MAKSSEKTSYSAEEMAAEREATPASGEQVYVNTEPLTAGQPPTLNYTASDEYVATITPPAEGEAVEEDEIKVGSDWWLDGAGKAWRRDQIIGVAIPKSGKKAAADRIALDFGRGGGEVQVPTPDPRATMQELVK